MKCNYNFDSFKIKKVGFETHLPKFDLPAMEFLGPNVNESCFIR